jgi:imidazolonepropionase-like amidohydrolase
VPLVLEGATLIDGTDRQPLARSAVVIQGSRITFAGHHRSARPPRGAQRLDLSGLYLIPGLIDMHAHVLVPRAATQQHPTSDHPRFDRAVSERMLSVLLRFGITTVRSPATPTDFVGEISPGIFCLNRSQRVASPPVST